MINRIVARHQQAVAGGLVALAAALAGCGSAASTPTLPAAGVAEMDAHLKAVQSSANQRDRAGATTELDAFAGDVARARSAGSLTPGDYAALETGIARTRARIGVELPATPAVSTPAVATPRSTPAVSTTPSTAPAPATAIQSVAPAAQPSPGAPPGRIKAAKGAGRASDHGHGPGKGPGKGHGKG
jgi:hypothetical protein